MRAVLRCRIEALSSRFGCHQGSDAGAILGGLGRPGGAVRQPPVAAQEVLSICRREWGLDELTKVMERDPALSQTLLRHANSAWYAGRSPQSLLSIKAAVLRVGTKGVDAAVMFHLLQGELARPGSGLDELVAKVWEHMTRTGPLARAMARAFRADPDDAFTLALLHDVGKLIFFDRVAEERRRLRRDVRLPDGFVAAALAALHEPLGGLAALEWGLDARSALVIGTHHRRGDHPLGEPLSEVVHAAEAVDIARERGEALDLPLLWATGDLTGSLEAAAEALRAEGNEEAGLERAERRRRALRR